MKKLFVLLTASIFLISCQKETKTAFVVTETIFKEYKGIKAQEAVFKQQQEAFNKKYDSLVNQWKKEVADFQQNISKMSPKKAQKKDQELYQKQQIIQQMQQQEGAQLSAEMQKKNDSIIKLVYDFFADYGKKNGYTYIYGKNNSGSLMYGEANLDITDAILKAMDAAYEAEKK